MQRLTETMKRRAEVLEYLESVFCKERPNRSLREFRQKTRAISTDELYRIADAIQRFGLDNLL